LMMTRRKEMNVISSVAVVEEICKLKVKNRG